MTRLLLIRHGESIWNADPPLSDRGREQARAAAAAVGQIDAIVTSDLQRAAETGAIIARSLGVDHLATDAGLRERDAGALSGLTRTEIFERFPGLLADDPAGFVPGDDGEPRWPDDWEPDASLVARVTASLGAIVRLVPDGDVLVVTHGGVIYAVERDLGSEPRGRLANLQGVTVTATPTGLALGDRVSLVDPAGTTPVEADRI